MPQLHLRDKWLKFLYWFYSVVLRLKLCQADGYHCRNKGKRQRQDTQYHEDELNYVFCCDSCLKEINKEWAERWKEYYSGL